MNGSTATNNYFFKAAVVLFTMALLLFSQINFILVATAVAPDSIVAVDGVNIPNGPDEWPVISADGRYIAFSSSSGNLTDRDSNDLHDMYRYDTVTQTFERLNENDDEEVSGEAFSGDSHTISDDGRYVAFYADGTDLVPGITNGDYNVFVRDTVTGTIDRVNEGPGGIEGDSGAYDPIISGDGNIVAFPSEATNLDPTSTNNNWGFFAHNRTTGETRLITKGAVGRTWNDGGLGYPEGISYDGNEIVFNAYDDTVDPMVVGGPSDGTYMYRWDTDSIELISQSTGGVAGDCCIQEEADMSSDGRYVFFISSADNLVAGDTNNQVDIFMRDTQTDTTTRVVETFPGVQEGIDSLRISADGTKLMFVSDTDYDSDGSPIGDLDDGEFFSYDSIFWMWDLTGGTMEALNIPMIGFGSIVYNLSGDGSKVVVELDFGDGLSPQGTHIYDVDTSTLELIGEDEVVCPNNGTGISNRSDLSADGRYLAYETSARHIILQTGGSSSGTDIFVYDSQTGTHEMASVNSNEEQNDTFATHSLDPSISADGNFIAFESTASNLVPGDTNGRSDIFVRDILAGTTEQVSLANGGVQPATFDSNAPSISADARYVAFQSYATDLVPGFVDGDSDIFVYDRTLDTIKQLQVPGASHLFNPQISADGLMVTFTARIGGIDQIVLYTIATDVFTTVTAGNAATANPDVSADGSLIVFQSTATNLVAGDTNGVSDIFLYNTNTLTTTLISQYNSTLADGGSFEPKISDDGSVIVFDSVATNLVDDDTNAVSDVFKYDTSDSTMERITERVDGDESLYSSTYKNISPDGELVSVSSMNKNFTGDCADDHDRGFFDRPAMFLFVPGEPVVLGAPTVTTSPASAITETIATLNGEITDIGTSPPTERGFEYGLDNTYGTTVSEVGTFIAETFSEDITGLTCNTTYYFRAFATSPDGTGNGAEETFTTSACPVAPGGGGSSGSTTNPSVPPLIQPFIPLLPVIPPVVTAPPASSNPPSTSGGSGSDSSDSSSDSSDSSDQDSATDPDVVTPFLPEDQPTTPIDVFPDRDGSTTRILDQVSGWVTTAFGSIPLTPLSTASLILLFALLPLATTPLITFIGSLVPLGLAGIQLIYSRYLQNLLSFLGLRKKRRIWGTVYDSVTKQPLDPAVVELIDATTGIVKERAITDLAGRFGFLATEGTFKLRASKTHYAFPSTRETGASDEIFGNLYHGEALNMSEGSTLVAPNIPMDPVGFDWNQEAKQKLLPSRLRLHYIVQVLFNTLFAVGFIFALYNYFEYGGAWNTFTLCMYFLVMLLRLLLKPKHLWGRLTKNGEPMVDVKVELLHPKFNVVMGKALSSIDGKFFLKVPEPGDYNLRISTRHGLMIHEGTARVGKERVFNADVNF